MATIRRKQLKRTYKIPRSLKKSIKKNLVKIVKKRERKTREEEREKYSVRHKAIMARINTHLDRFDSLWPFRQTYGDLKDQLEALIRAGFYELALEREGHKGGLIAQKVLAKRWLEYESTDEDLREEITEWLIDQDEDADEIEKLGKIEGDENEDEESGLETAEEYDWTSTSTLE